MGMHLAEPADRSRAADDARRSAGTQAAQGVWLEPKLRNASGQREQILEIRFNVVEIQGLSHAAPLLRPTRAGRNTRERFHFSQGGFLHLELIADFEQPHARLLP